VQILLPVGRLISGSVHKLQQQKDAKTKQPKVDATGKPVENINFRVAVPKTQADWRNESFMHPKLGVIAWGKQMYDIAKGAQPLCDQIKDFAFKIKDGDSTHLDSKLKPYNQGIGRPGHWVISIQQSWAPKLVTADGMNELAGDKFVVGYFIQVLADVKYNGSTDSPGLYVNPVAVALAGAGEAISVDVDTTSVGFGGTALPAGAVVIAPAVEGFAPVVAAPAQPLIVQPNTQFMQPPAQPASPAQPAAPIAFRYVMTPKAGTYTREQCLATPGWTDDLLIAQGYMTLG
jgi:hypothetical protein